MEVALAEISKLVAGEIQGDANKIIRGALPFDEANGHDITYAESPRFLKKINESNAGAIIVPNTFQSSDRNIIKTDSPRIAFAKVIRLFYPKIAPEPGQRETAHIGKNLKCGKNSSIGHFVVIGNNVVLGDNVQIHPHVFIGDDVLIGDDTAIYPNVTVFESCEIGSRVIIHSGTVIGSDGFGFAPEGESYYKIPHTGIVQIDDDVEIGAGNTIDRATFGKTWIKKGVKTDNLIHIAHNVVIGENTLILAQVGIAGSATIGKHSVLSGRSGVKDHITIGDDVIVGSRSSILQSISNGEVVSGMMPTMPHRLYLKVQNIIPKLPELKKRIKAIEKKIEKINGQKT
jgi:UDP-3-O-[3-hydroxymyristoyl] glucosamine N-acyltransferase